MGEIAGKFDVEKVMSYGDDLVAVLKDKRDINYSARCLHHFNHLRSSSAADLHKVHNFLRDYEKRLEACEEKTAVVKSEVIADEELELLQRELDGLDGNESLHMEELRVVTDEVDELESQLIAVEEKIRGLKGHEEDQFMEQMKLSMYASVTNIIPYPSDQSHILGDILDRDKKIVRNFEFDPRKMADFEICDSIWKMIS